MADFSEIFERFISAPSGRRRDNLVRLLSRQRLCDKVEPKRPEVRTWSQEEVLNALRDLWKRHGKLRVKLVEKEHEQHPELVPSTTTIAQLFGTPRNASGWTQALVLLGAARPTALTWRDQNGVIGPPPRTDVRYLVNVIKQFGIKSANSYYEARRRYPEVVPPYRYVKQELGGLTTVHKLLRLESCQSQLEALVRLMKELDGRWPRRSLCRARSIDRAFLERRFGGKKELEGLCRELLSHMWDTEGGRPDVPQKKRENREKRRRGKAQGCGAGGEGEGELRPREDGTVPPQLPS